MSRRTATILFTDLVGSTELSVRWGAAFDEARRAHDALLRSAVEAHGGEVVKGTGDGLMATFPAAADGLAAARAAQQAIHRRNRQGREPALSIRVGLGVGDVSFEDGDCFGECVVEAARLCALAEGDVILATEAVRLAAGARRALGFRACGSLELRGLPEPVPTVEVEWERVERSTTPLPPRLAAPDARFVGRVEELATLGAAFDEAARGSSRRVVLVGGEPGLGKTTVVAEAARGWHDLGATVAMGWCEEDVRAPYRPFAEALAHLVAAAPLELLHGHVERCGPALVTIVPSLARRVERLPGRAGSDPETERYLLLAAVADLLGAMGEQAPVVLFLDDLHWADAATASLLRSLAGQPEAARLLIVGTFRSDELRADHPMGQALAAFRRVPNVERLQLGGLDESEVVELLGRWTGVDHGAGAARLAAELVAETGGNAFFVTEVVRHLEETGRLTELFGATVAARVMPDSVREVLGERVARLGSTADEVLGVAAVVGAEFDLSVLTSVTGLADAKVLEVLGGATSAALVREVDGSPGRFRFAHALVQQAVLANLGGTREAALHRRVAEALEAAGGAAPVAELARHWFQATQRSDVARARDWARQAGDDAIAALAPGDAVAFYRQALLLHDQAGGDEGERIDLMIRLGTAERQAGDPEHRDTLLRAARLARRADDGPRLAAAALANNVGTFSVFGGVDAERVDMLEAAVAVGAAPADEALLLGTLANELTYSGDFARRRALVDDAVRAARSTGDPALLVRVFNQAFYPLWVPETLAERLAMSDESLALLDAVDDPSIRYWASMAAYLNRVQAADVAGSEAPLSDVTRLGDRLAQPALQWRARHTEATRLLLHGEPDAAAPFVEAAIELGTRAGALETVGYAKSQELCLHWQRGTMAELSARIRGASARPPGARASLALVLAEAGRADEAAVLLGDVDASGLAELPRDPAYATCCAFLAEAAVLTDDPRLAGALHERLAPYADQIGFDGVTTVGGLEHYVGALAGLLGRADEAVERLERSGALHQRIGSPFFLARDHLQLGRALRRRGGAGDADRARAELEEAARLGAAHGYRLVHRRAAQELLDP